MTRIFKMQGEKMLLWIQVMKIINLLQGAFTRRRTFLWFTVAVIGFCTRSDLAGVTSIIRCMCLHERCYISLLGFFGSNAIRLDQLTVLWVKVVLDPKKSRSHPSELNTRAYFSVVFRYKMAKTLSGGCPRTFPLRNLKKIRLRISPQT